MAKKKIKSKNKYLYDWVFVFNPWEELWYAVTRDQITNYYSNKDAIPKNKVVKHRNHSDLVTYLKMNYE